MSLKNWFGKRKTQSNAQNVEAHTQQNFFQEMSAFACTAPGSTSEHIKTLGTLADSDTTANTVTVYTRVNAVSRTEEGVWYIDGEEVGNIYELCRALCELRSVDFVAEIGNITDEV